jgi:hypothetical protein
LVRSTNRLQVSHHTNRYSRPSAAPTFHAEKVAQLIAEAAIPQIPLETMRQV